MPQSRPVRRQPVAVSLCTTRALSVFFLAAGPLLAYGDVVSTSILDNNAGRSTGDGRSWLASAQSQVGTAQLVLDEVGRGLATAERAEAVADRAVPMIRRATIVILGCAVGLGIVLLLSRRRRRIKLDESELSEPSPTPAQTIADPDGIREGGHGK
jgi:hypothetical protein